MTIILTSICIRALFVGFLGYVNRSKAHNAHHFYFIRQNKKPTMTEINRTEWDPLKSSSDIPEELVSAAKKRQIKNILKSYVGLYDPFSELIQNAMDAVDLRRSQGERNYKPKVSIQVNLKENTFTITDNGIGFNRIEFTSFLSPDISFKEEDKGTRGNKGVGATFLAYGYNTLKISTKTPGFETNCIISNGRNWVEDTTSTVTRPMVKTVTETIGRIEEIDRGSAFTIVFGGEKTRPKNLGYFAATTANQWQYLLLIKTPLGIIDFKSEENPILFDLEVIDSSKTVTELNNQESKYIFPHEVISSHVDLKVINGIQQKLIQEGKDPSSIPSMHTNLNGVFEFFSYENLVIYFEDKLTDDEQEQLIDYEVTAYGYFCYSTKIWDQFSDGVANLRKGVRILRGGLQLSNNRMAQGELITIPLTQNIGYQNQAHIIVHFENAHPDLGRKGFQPELESLAGKLSVLIVNRLKVWRRLLKNDSGAAPQIVNEGLIFDWIMEQVAYEKEQPLEITNPNFFLPLKEISITSNPRVEQDVIVLFNQLIAGGVIRGLRLMSTSQYKQYDGIFRYFFKMPAVNHQYEKIANPLGLEKVTHSEDYTSKPYVLEYKYNIDGLIQEFENGEKDENSVDLAIAWEMGTKWKTSYNIISLLNIDNLHHRSFHGQTHIFCDENTGQVRFHAIILSELLKYLNDVDSVQEFQKNEYGE